MLDSKPSISLSEDQISNLREWQNGEEYTVVMVLEQKSSGEEEYMDNKYIARLEIKSVKLKKEKSIDDMDNEEFTDYARKQKRKDFK